MLSAQRVEGGLFIKMSNIYEGQATDFVRTHTHIPVPVVVDNVTVDGVTALVLSRLPGISLAQATAECRPSDEHVDKMAKQLSVFMTELRSLPPPSSGVGGFGGQPIRCERVAFGATPRGPWSSVADFHTSLVDNALLSIPSDQAETVLSSIRSAHSRGHRVCLTHNDLGPHNILADEHFNVTGIIDWDTAAWMPEYW